MAAHARPCPVRRGHEWAHNRGLPRIGDSGRPRTCDLAAHPCPVWWRIVGRHVKVAWSPIPRPRLHRHVLVCGRPKAADFLAFTSPRTSSRCHDLGIHANPRLAHHQRPHHAHEVLGGHVRILGGHAPPPAPMIGCPLATTHAQSWPSTLAQCCLALGGHARPSLAQSWPPTSVHRSAILSSHVKALGSHTTLTWSATSPNRGQPSCALWSATCCSGQPPNASWTAMRRLWAAIIGRPCECLGHPQRWVWSYVVAQERGLLGIHARPARTHGSPPCALWATNLAFLGIHDGLWSPNSGIVGKPPAFSGPPRLGWRRTFRGSWAAITLPHDFVGCHA